MTVIATYKNLLDMVQRIEVTERYRHVSPQAEAEAEAVGTEPDYTIQYRRVFLRLDDIFAPKELPGKKSHCLLEFNDGAQMIIRENYDDFCIRLNDLENQSEEDEPME